MIVQTCARIGGPFTILKHRKELKYEAKAGIFLQAPRCFEIGGSFPYARVNVLLKRTIISVQKKRWINMN